MNLTALAGPLVSVARGFRTSLVRILLIFHAPLVHLEDSLLVSRYAILLVNLAAGAPTRITLGLQYVNNVLLGNTWIVKALRQLLSVRIVDLVHTPKQREVLLVRNVKVANIVMPPRLSP